MLAAGLCGARRGERGAPEVSRRSRSIPRPSAVDRHVGAPGCGAQVARPLLLVCCLLVLAGCTPVVERKVVTNVREAWAHRVSALSRYPAWRLRGRVGIQRGEEGWQAGLEWAQDGDRFLIELSDPLGRKVAVLRGRPGQVALKTSRGESATAASPEGLMEALLGWSLPVSGLRYWVRGLPAPGSDMGATRMEWDDRGRLSRLQQADWTIVYAEYGQTPELSMPRVLRLTQGPVAVKLLIKEWRLSATDRSAGSSPARSGITGEAPTHTWLGPVGRAPEPHGKAATGS